MAIYKTDTVARAVEAIIEAVLRDDTRIVDSLPYQNGREHGRVFHRSLAEMIGSKEQEQERGSWPGGRYVFVAEHRSSDNIVVWLTAGNNWGEITEKEYAAGKHFDVADYAGAAAEVLQHLGFAQEAFYLLPCFERDEALKEAAGQEAAAEAMALDNGCRFG